MRNIIIGLGAALALSTELVACGEADVVQLLDQAEYTRGSHGSAAGSFELEALVTHPSFRTDIAPHYAAAESFKFLQIPLLRLNFLITGEGGFDTPNAYLNTTDTSNFIKTIDSFVLSPESKWPTVSFITDITFAATFAHLLVVEQKAVRTCATVTVSQKRISKYDDATIKAMREAKEAAKQRDRDRKNARDRKFAARD